jgi:hypothetical protein
MNRFQILLLISTCTATPRFRWGTARTASSASRSGRGVIENKHSTDVHYPHPPPRVCLHIHTRGETCSDLGSSACSQRPSCQVAHGRDHHRHRVVVRGTPGHQRAGCSHCGRQGLMDSARHVIGCHSTQETRVQNACDDVASTIHQSLAGGVLRVIGKEFGPKGSAAFDAVTVRDSKSRLVPCLAPRVVEDDTAVECDLPAGSGKAGRCTFTLSNPVLTEHMVSAPLAVHVDSIKSRDVESAYGCSA